MSIWEKGVHTGWKPVLPGISTGEDTCATDPCPLSPNPVGAQCIAPSGLDESSPYRGWGGEM